MADWKRIVVGVDGSDGSRAALQRAFELAQELGSELLLVADVAVHNDLATDLQCHATRRPMVGVV